MEIENWKLEIENWKLRIGISLISYLVHLVNLVKNNSMSYAYKKRYAIIRRNSICSFHCVIFFCKRAKIAEMRALL